MTEAVRVTGGSCEGPLLWFDVDPDERRGWAPDAILVCSGCGFMVVTGGLMDLAHVDTPLVRN